VRIELGWSRRQSGAEADDRADPGGTPQAADIGRELAPPAPPVGAGLAPPDSDEEPLRGDKNQEPAAGGPTGFSISHSQEKTSEAEAPIRDVAPVSVTATTAVAAMPAAVESPGPRSTVDHPAGSPPRSVPNSGKPDLRHIVPEDLVDTGRLLELYAQAVAAGLVPASEWGRLRFVAAAEHARAIGAKNPCGLFSMLVRSGRLHFATEDDAQAASLRIRRHLYGVAPPSYSAAEQGGMLRGMPHLSEDARLVQAVRAAAARARYRGDPFPLLKRQQPEWTRERWDQAVRELDG
jgi:hypothetical protein